MKYQNILRNLFIIIISVLLVAGFVKAGSLNPALAPAATFYTLDDIYTRLTNNAAGAVLEGSHNLGPAALPVGTMRTLKEIYEIIPPINAAKILSDTTYLGVTGSIINGSNVTVTSSTPTDMPAGYYSGKTCSAALTGGTGSVAGAGQILDTYHAWDSTGNVLQGSITTQTLNLANETVNAGYYAATTLSAVDGDLAAGNIVSGITIFGKLGTFKALLPTTFQVLCYDTDGGAAIACAGVDWPDQDADASGDSGACTPTYTQGTYTVTDSCTNLEWQRYGHGSDDGSTVPAADGDCDLYSGTYSASYCTYTWQNALKYCSGLVLDGHDDWRLANVKELQSIIKYSTFSPAIDTTKFSSTKSDYYWSSTTVAGNASDAWGVGFGSGGVGNHDKTISYYVRCVRQ
jgi:hypothetical protein